MPSYNYITLYLSEADSEFLKAYAKVKGLESETESKVAKAVIHEVKEEWAANQAP